MKWYVELTLLPDAEAPIYFLWERLYQKIHSILSTHAFDKEVLVGKEQRKEIIKISNVGIAFPEFKNSKHHPLGVKLRLIAENKQSLEQLNLPQLFSSYADNLHLKSLQQVPKDKITDYAFFKRVAIKGNVERLARRREKRLQDKGIEVSYEEALDYFVNDQERKQSENTSTKASFVYFYSETWKRRFPLFIVMEPTEHSTGKAEFSCYGLSANSSVPLF